MKSIEKNAMCIGHPLPISRSLESRNGRLVRSIFSNANLYASLCINQWPIYETPHALDDSSLAFFKGITYPKSVRSSNDQNQRDLRAKKSRCFAGCIPCAFLSCGKNIPNLSDSIHRYMWNHLKFSGHKSSNELPSFFAIKIAFFVENKFGDTLISS